MGETFGLQAPHARAFGDEDAPRLVRHVAYVSQGHAAQRARQPCEVARADGEEKLEVFAAVEREQERVERAAAADADDGRVYGDARGFDDRARAAGAGRR